MKRKHFFKGLIYILILGFGLSSCQDYLDKSPAAGLTDADVFKSFDKFQGFIEDGYDCMIDPSTVSSQNNFNWGDDLLMTQLSYMSSINSDYRGWETAQCTPFYAIGNGLYSSNPYFTAYGMSSGDGRSNFGYWQGGWAGIRKANLALANLDKMTISYKGVNLQDQKDLIEGQARFLRAFLHFSIIRAWGGMPYITKVFTPNDKLDYKRLTYAASSDSIENDLLIAVQKLPINWDDTETGKISVGTNQGRFTKGAAYALLGKVMLYAGSPLMNGSSTGDYTYNKEYCKKAAKYFWQIIQLSALGGGSTYDLLPWINYSQNFYGFARLIPGRGKEGVLNTLIVAHARNAQVSEEFDTMGGWSTGCGPLENYVEYFGMKDGTRFDPNIYNTPTINPWKNRDPRFYKNIIYDGSCLMKTSPISTPAKLYIGGSERGGVGRSDTGYGWQKYRDSTIWASNGNGWSTDINRCVPVIRLADVYLMYAEAVTEAYGANVDPSSVDPNMTGCHIKAWQAVKAVRDRVLNPDGTSLPLPASFYVDDNAMRETIRRERAVELAFEGHRWYDLRRWYVSDQPEYMRLDVLDFDKDHTYFKIRSYGKKVFEKKHFWLPIRNSEVQISQDFVQNPGW